MVGDGWRAGGGCGRAGEVAGMADWHAFNTHTHTPYSACMWRMVARGHQGEGGDEPWQDWVQATSRLPAPANKLGAAPEAHVQAQSMWRSSETELHGVRRASPRRTGRSPELATAPGNLPQHPRHRHQQPVCCRAKQTRAPAPQGLLWRPASRGQAPHAALPTGHNLPQLD